MSYFQGLNPTLCWAYRFIEIALVVLNLSQKAYINKVLSRFGMKDCELGNTTNSKGDKFSLLQCPRNKIKKKDMKKIPYALVVGSLKYAQVCKC